MPENPPGADVFSRLTNVMVGAAVWAMSSPHRRDRRAQIDFYATRMWNDSDRVGDSSRTPEAA